MCGPLLLIRLMISNTMLHLSITLQNKFGFTLSSENLMSLIFLFNLKHLSKKNLIEKSSYSTLTMAGNIKPYPHFLQLMVFLILPLLYIHYNIIGILNIVIITLLEQVSLFSHASMPLSY